MDAHPTPVGHETARQTRHGINRIESWFAKHRHRYALGRQEQIDALLDVAVTEADAAGLARLCDALLNEELGRGLPPPEPEPRPRRPTSAAHAGATRRRLNEMERWFTRNRRRLDPGRQGEIDAALDVAVTADDAAGLYRLLALSLGEAELAAGGVPGPGRPGRP